MRRATSDIIERLRRIVGQEGIGPVDLVLLARDAADEIERLQSELAALSPLNKTMQQRASPAKG